MTTSPATATHSFMYLETTIPAGCTIADYRRSRPRRPGLWKRVYGALTIAP